MTSTSARAIATRVHCAVIHLHPTPAGARHNPCAGLRSDGTGRVRTSAIRYDNFIDALQRERAFRSAMREWRQYQGWKQHRNPARAALEAAHGYDTKHASHLVRLLRMALEIVGTGEVHVWRGDRDADELRAIRDGAWSYDALIDFAESTEAELADDTAPGWFKYDAWRFFIRYVSPVAVAAIVIAVFVFGVDFS